MSEYTRPLPQIQDPVQQPFWEAARRHEFVLQECGLCRARRWPPSPICPGCLETGGGWVPVETTGTVWSFAIYDHAYREDFAADIPYNVSVIDLDAGPTMISNVVGVDPAALTIGDRVTVAFDDVTDEVTLVKFRPVDA